MWWLLSHNTSLDHFALSTFGGTAGKCVINTWGSRQNVCCFTDDISKLISLNESYCILNQISLKYVRSVRFNSFTNITNWGYECILQLSLSSAFLCYDCAVPWSYEYHWQLENVPDSKVYGTNMGPIWGRQDPGGPHVGLMNFAIWGYLYFAQFLRLSPLSKENMLSVTEQIPVGSSVNDEIIDTINVTVPCTAFVVLRYLLKVNAGTKFGHY